MAAVNCLLLLTLRRYYLFAGEKSHVQKKVRVSNSHDRT
jgi:hypothetical protein